MTKLPNPFMNLPVRLTVPNEADSLTGAEPAIPRRPSFCNEYRFVLDTEAFMAAIEENGLFPGSETGAFI